MSNTVPVSVADVDVEELDSVVLVLDMVWDVEDALAGASLRFKV